MANPKPAGTPAVAAPAKPAAAPANAAPAGQAGANATKQGASIVLASGEKRVDYIRRRYSEGAKRGEIAKELGVPYQIVFAATKAKKEAATAAAAK